MLYWLRWVRKRVLRWWKPPPPRTIRIPPAPPPLSTAAPAAENVTTISQNRHERRQLERARRKYDKFIKPNGPAIEKPKRETQQIKPRLKRVEVVVPDEQIHDAEIMIADSHHENRDDTVLYKESEMYGEFNFRDTILQQLERYFVYIDRMKKYDRDAYGYYKEVGATILPYLATGAWKRGEKDADDEEARKHVTPLPEYFHRTRPSFGCFVYGADPETERYEMEGRPGVKGKWWVPKFMYFRKYKKPPPELQLIAGGDIYAMTIYWDRPFDKKIKYGRPQEFGIFVSADGKEVVALKACDTKYIPVPSKRETRHSYRTSHYTRGPIPKRRELGHIVVPQRAYRIPSDFEKWAHDHGEDCQHFLTELFKTSIMRCEQARYSMTRVTATKDGTAAVFGVNVRRTSYFFQDRDITVDENGERKRIFHFVRPHVRHNGAEVKAHFRGQRKFNWAGYEIEITVPGLDHLDIGDIDVGAEDSYWQEEGVKYVDMATLGKDLKELMHRKKGASR